MNREILFRGKAINRDKFAEYRTKYNNGDWVYGLISKPHNEMFPDIPSEMTNTDGISGIEVDYKTLGQYTGLTDKNGVKIFEGDIIKTKKYGKIVGHANVNDFDVFEVVYTPCRFRLEKKNRGFNLVDNGYSEFEIISNIHDNPELMGGDENNV